ncbi:MAG TPA: hypothetical protein DEV93_02135 [Chloroflexi bacterium]|nr:hypothetical protein [Chloroflexota bacterium]
MSGQARILLLCDDRRGHANTVLDHMEAFTRFSRHEVRTFNPKSLRRSAALDLDDFDVIVIHYSVVLSSPLYISPHFQDKLQRFRGLKIQFIQDDYRWVDRATAAARDVGINVLFTVAPEPAAGQLYDASLPGVRRVETLTGYVPDNLRDRTRKPLGERKIDVGYRARDLPFWLGKLSREKAVIGQRFLELAPGFGLRCDIGWREHERIYGSQWIEFVSSSRATLGTESGASIADFDGSAEMAVRAYLRAHPAAAFQEVHEAVLRPYEGNVVVNVISPRVFEAASLGTALIMFPGHYSGIVSSGDHYIALKKDFSNIDDVVAQLRDDDLVNAMTTRAREDLIESGRWSYRSFIAEFDRVVDEEAPRRRGPSRALRYRLAKAERALLVPGPSVRLFRGAHAIWMQIFRRDPSMRFTIEYESQVEKGFLALRSALGDRALRPLLRLGRRAGSPIDRLLREILELSLLRKAARGDLPGDQDFTLKTEFDAARKALTFVSTPVGYSADGGQGHADLIRAALHAGELTAIEWDHRALGGIIRLDRPAMEVGVGYKGLESFTALVEIGRRDPPALEQALAPLLATLLQPVQATVD